MVIGLAGKRIRHSRALTSEFSNVLGEDWNLIVCRPCGQVCVDESQTRRFRPASQRVVEKPLVTNDSRHIDQPTEQTGQMNPVCTFAIPGDHVRQFMQDQDIQDGSDTVGFERVEESGAFGAVAVVGESVNKNV